MRSRRKRQKGAKRKEVLQDKSSMTKNRHRPQLECIIGKFAMKVILLCNLLAVVEWMWIKQSLGCERI